MTCLRNNVELSSFLAHTATLSCNSRLMQIRDTDLDTLERVVGIVAFGDLEGEDTCNLTDLNFLRIFRLSQLTAEYLLHVQDKLAQENAQLKVICLLPGDKQKELQGYPALGSHACIALRQNSDRLWHFAMCIAISIPTWQQPHMGKDQYCQHL